MTSITIELSDEQLAGLRFWHTVSADFGDVEHHTGADLIAVLNGLATKVASTGETPTSRDERTLYRWTVADADQLAGREVTDDEIGRIEKAMGHSSAGESFEAVVFTVCDRSTAATPTTNTEAD